MFVSLLSPCTIKGPLVEPLTARVRCSAVLSSQGVLKNGTEEAMEQEMKSGTIRMPRRCFSTTRTRIDFLYNYSCMKRSHKRDLERDLERDLAAGCK